MALAQGTTDRKGQDLAKGNLAAIPHFHRWVVFFRVALDLASIFLGALGGTILWNGFVNGVDAPAGTLQVVLISVAVGGLSCAFFGLYTPERSFLDILEQRQVLRAGILGACGTRLLLFLMRQPVDPVLFASIWAGSVIALHFGRRCFHALGEWLRERGLAETLALVYGAGLTGRRLARQLARIPELGIRPLGFLDDDPDLLGKDVEGLPVLGDFSTLEHHLCAGIVRRLFIAHPRLPHRSILDIMDLCRKHSVPFQIVPSIPEQLVPLAELQDLEGIPLLGPPPLHQRRLDQVGRRMLDLIAALPLALCALPTALVLWPRRCANGQSLFVRHRRIGLHGRPILVLKFRTNREYPQRNGPERFIASLPMAWNLLRGDLSLVGPRPMTAREVENLDRMHLFRLQWRPGLTGLWRLARVEEDLFDDFEADLQYVRSQSLLLDLSILLRTLDLPWRRTRRS